MAKETIPFSTESLVGIVVAGLLVFGIASGFYQRVRHNAAVDAYRLGDSEAARHNLRNAIDHYNEALQRDPDYYNAYCRRAEAYEELGQDREAESDLKRAITIHPLWPFALDLELQLAQTRGKRQPALLSKSLPLKQVMN